MALPRSAFFLLGALACASVACADEPLIDAGKMFHRYGLDKLVLPPPVTDPPPAPPALTRLRLKGVTAKRFRLEVTLQKDWSAGVLKWRLAQAGKTHVEKDAQVSVSFLAQWKSDPPTLTGGQVPKDRMDRTTGHVHWYPHTGSVEWIDYTFAQPVSVDAAEVYWFDDTGAGNCHLPATWRILYEDGKDLRPVEVLADESPKPPLAGTPAIKSTSEPPAAGAAERFFQDNIPLFECPDSDIQEIYYFRWGVYRKHIKTTPDGFVVTEFLPKVGWSGKHNTINCPAGHHFYEGRWLRDPKYLNDYAVFWFRKGGDPRRYSFWAADAYYNRYLVNLDKAFLVGLLGDLVRNYQAWEAKRMHPNGMFWQNDGEDGMEVSIGGSGVRTTINSYMYADALAIARIAELAGRSELVQPYRDKAARIKQMVQTALWDAQARFFKTLPKPDGKLVDVREEIGLVPWYFNLPDPGAGYEQAWKQLMDPEGFYAPFGPTTAERRHGRFMFASGHECLWNGPSWPFATTQTLVGLANVLNNYRQDAVGKKDYLETLRIYARSQHLKTDDGTVVPWIDENLHPLTGAWQARSIMYKANRGDKDRGRDYNHSGFCDLVISGLVGLRPREDDTLVVNPLVPEGTWDYFCLDRVLYHGKLLTILYDKTGGRYNRGAGLRVFADGKLVASSEKIEKVTGKL